MREFRVNMRGWSPEELRRAMGFDAASVRANPSRRYVPTLGMLRALVDDRGATAFDYERCRMRGLVREDRMPTPAGRAVIADFERRAARHG